MVYGCNAVWFFGLSSPVVSKTKEATQLKAPKALVAPKAPTTPVAPAEPKLVI